jgi:hypothetical protein
LISSHFCPYLLFTNGKRFDYIKYSTLAFFSFQNGLNNRFQNLGENSGSWWKSALITTALGIGSLAVLTVCK